MFDLILSFRSLIPVRRFISCVCSKVKFLCGMVSFITGLTGWIDKSSFFVISVICIVPVGIVGNLIVGARVCLATVFVVAVIAGTIFVALGLVLPLFELMALVSVVAWLFELVTSWFGFFLSLLCDLLRHSIQMQRIWSFPTVQFQRSFKM